MHSLIPEEAVGADVSCTLPIMNIRQGSNELDSSSSIERSSPVMLSAAKHLAADRDRLFAALRACVWITHIVTRPGPLHRSQASMRGAATRGRKTDLGGLRCGDPTGVPM